MKRPPRVVSVNVGGIRPLAWHGREVASGIDKRPVPGRVRVHSEGLEGDAQADRRVHGGPAKALYAYPLEHYAAWERELAASSLGFGSFGENLTLEGLSEKDVRRGDRLQIGSVEVQVTQPRVPCFKLAARFGRADMVRRFLRSGRSGFYLAVLREGELGAGDEILWLERASSRPTLAEEARAKLRGRGEGDSP